MGTIKKYRLKNRSKNKSKKIQKKRKKTLRKNKKKNHNRRFLKGGESCTAKKYMKNCQLASPLCRITFDCTDKKIFDKKNPDTRYNGTAQSFIDHHYDLKCCKTDGCLSRFNIKPSSNQKKCLEAVKHLDRDRNENLGDFQEKIRQKDLKLREESKDPSREYYIWQNWEDWDKEEIRNRRLAQKAMSSDTSRINTDSSLPRASSISQSRAQRSSSSTAVPPRAPSISQSRAQRSSSSAAVPPRVQRSSESQAQRTSESQAQRTSESQAQINLSTSSNSTPSLKDQNYVDDILFNKAYAVEGKTLYEMIKYTNTYEEGDVHNNTRQHKEDLIKQLNKFIESHNKSKPVKITNKMVYDALTDVLTDISGTNTDTTLRLIKKKLNKKNSQLEIRIGLFN